MYDQYDEDSSIEDDRKRTSRSQTSAFSGASKTPPSVRQKRGQVSETQVQKPQQIEGGKEVEKPVKLMGMDQRQTKIEEKSMTKLPQQEKESTSPVAKKITSKPVTMETKEKISASTEFQERQAVLEKVLDARVEAHQKRAIITQAVTETVEITKKPASKSQMAIKEMPRVIRVESETKQDELENNHYGFSCHLFPRLSESNLQFHDLYWNRETENGTISLRKRRVAVNKLLKSFSIRVDSSEPVGTGANFHASISLLDRRPFAKRQIVSNIFTCPVPLAGSGLGRVLRKSPSSATIFIRSNYRQREVALQIVLERHSSLPSGTNIGNSPDAVSIVGRVELEMLDEKGQMALQNGTQNHMFFDGKIRFDFEMADVPTREQFNTDSLPDVLVCNHVWVPMLAIYRQLVVERLAEDGDCLFAERTTLLSDPIIGTFPTFLDKDRNGVELFLALLHKYNVAISREFPAQEAVRRFRFVYIQFIMPLLSMVDPGNWRKQLRAFVNGETSLEPNPITAMASEQCRMLDVNEYAIQLCGNHAID